MASVFICAEERFLKGEDTLKIILRSWHCLTARVVENRSVIRTSGVHLVYTKLNKYPEKKLIPEVGKLASHLELIDGCHGLGIIVFYRNGSHGV